jgi:hypothetical protein
MLWLMPTFVQTNVNVSYGVHLQRFPLNWQCVFVTWRVISKLLSCSSVWHQLDSWSVFAYPKQRATVLVGSVLKWRARPQCLHRQLKYLRVSKTESYGLSRICFEMTRQATMPSSKAWLCLADEQHICVPMIPQQLAAGPAQGWSTEIWNGCGISGTNSIWGEMGRLGRNPLVKMSRSDICDERSTIYCYQQRSAPASSKLLLRSFTLSKLVLFSRSFTVSAFSH